MRRGKCDFVTVITDFTLLLFVHMTEPNTAIKSSIVDNLLAARRENLRNRYAGLQSALVETLL